MLTRRRLLGLALLLLVVLIWVGSGQMMQYIFHDQDFDQPLFLTYFSTSMFLINLSGFAFVPTWRWGDDMRPAALKRQLVAWWKQDAAAVEPALGPSAGSAPPLTTPQTLALAAVLCPLWFWANYSYNVSVSLTTVASSTVLSSSSGLFTLLIGAHNGTEPFAWYKLNAALTVFVGVVLVAYADARDNHSGAGGRSSWLGDLLGLLSAAGYAAYVTTLKKRIGDEERVVSPMLLGFLGIACLLMLWPLFPILHVLQIERFQWPSAPVLAALALNGLVGTVLSDTLWLRAVLLTSPVIATVGLSLTIPVALLSDLILHGDSFSALYVFGAALVLCGVFAINMDELWWQQRMLQLRALLRLPRPQHRRLGTRDHRDADDDDTLEHHRRALVRDSDSDEGNGKDGEMRRVVDVGDGDDFARATLLPIG